MSEQSPPPLSDEDARQQRLEALRALAHTQSGAPPASTPPASAAPTFRASRRRRPWLLFGSVALVVVLGSGIVLLRYGIFPGQAAKSHGGPTSVVITPSLQDLDCLRDAAWSPDGRQLAVIGYRDQCPSDAPSSYNYQASVLDMYAATTGQLVRTILPDATVLALPGIPLPPGNAQPTTVVSDTSKTVIQYSRVLWSPDGKQLALTFFIERWNAAGTALLPGFRGLVLMNADGTHEHAALFTENSQRYSGLTWDTTTLRYLVLPAQQRYGYFVSLPPGMSYSWSAGGQLVPGSVLTATLAPTTPIGSPDGGSSFSIWQPGSLALTTESETPNNQLVTLNPGIYTWGTTFLAWSPDGRYLIDSISLLGITHPVGEPHPTADELKALGWDSVPNVTIRDLALQRLLTSLRATASQGGQSQIDVAWSPSGRVLAAIPEPSSSSPSSGSTTSPPVTFYDCSTGKTLGTLQPQGSSQAFSNSEAGLSLFVPTSLPLWSADGSRFLLFSQVLGTITIWGPGMLPKTS